MHQPDLYDVEPTHRCFACGHGYIAILPDEPVCPECGSQAVSLEGDVECRVLEHPADTSGNRLAITVDDETDRDIVYHFVVPDALAQLVVVRVAGVRLTPRTAEWVDVPLPEEVVETAEQEAEAFVVKAAPTTEGEL